MANTLTEHQLAMLDLLRETDRICRKHHIKYALFAGSLLGAVRHGGFIPWDDDLDVVMLRPEYERFLRAAAEEADERFFIQPEFSAHWQMFFSKFRLNGTTCLEKYHPKDLKTHMGVYIDIFPCDNASDSAFVRKLQFLASKIVIAKGLGRRGYDTDSRKKKLFMGLCRLLPMKPALALCRLKGSARSGYVHSFLGGASSYGKSVYRRVWFEKQLEAKFEGEKYPIPADYDALLTTLYGDYRQIPPESERTCKTHALLVDLEHSYEEYEHYRDGMEFEVHTRSIR